MVRSIVKASCFQPLLSVPQAIWGTLSSMVTSRTSMVPTLHQTQILWKARWWVMSTRVSQGDRNMGVEKRPLGWAPCWPSPYTGSLSLLFRAILKLDQIHPFDSLELSVKQTLNNCWAVGSQIFQFVSFRTNSKLAQILKQLFGAVSRWKTTRFSFIYVKFRACFERSLPEGMFNILGFAVALQKLFILTSIWERRICPSIPPCSVPFSRGPQHR